MNEVKLNGFTYYVDVKNHILFEDREQTKGTPFSFLTKNELEQVEKELRFPKPIKELIF